VPSLLKFVPRLRFTHTLAHSAPPDPLTGFEVSYFEGKGKGKREREGRTNSKQYGLAYGSLKVVVPLHPCLPILLKLH